MNVNHTPTRTIWPRADQQAVEIIDQTALPHRYRTLTLSSLGDAAHAIRSMQVRGAPLIGVTAAYGLALGLRDNAGDAALAIGIDALASTRPTAVNLHWALARMARVLQALPAEQRADAAWAEACCMAEEDVATNQTIGQHGLALLQPLARSGHPLQLLTHCNAGWLATVDHGTALAPVYAAQAAGIAVHVWVSETRPRNQGLLTAWELAEQGIPHTLIADNAAGYLLAQGKIDAVIVGADRIAANGDVANKVGTYLKALAARAHNVPFFVAAPRSTIDHICPEGAQIPIEERDGDELRCVHGFSAQGQATQVHLVRERCHVANPAFDVTPAALVTALITERGPAPASAAGLQALLAAAGQA